MPGNCNNWEGLCIHIFVCVCVYCFLWWYLISQFFKIHFSGDFRDSARQRSLIYVFIKHVLFAYSTVDTVLGTGDRKLRHNSYLLGAHSPGKQRTLVDLIIKMNSNNKGMHKIRSIVERNSRSDLSLQWWLRIWQLDRGPWVTQLLRIWQLGAPGWHSS